MAATIVLGVLIAGGFAYGIKCIYRNFSTGKAACCNGGAECPNCAKCKAFSTQAKS